MAPRTRAVTDQELLADMEPLANITILTATEHSITVVVIMADLEGKTSKNGAYSRDIFIRIPFWDFIRWFWNVVKLKQKAYLKSAWLEFEYKLFSLSEDTVVQKPDMYWHWQEAGGERRFAAVTCTVLFCSDFPACVPSGPSDCDQSSAHGRSYILSCQQHTNTHTLQCYI